MPAALDLAHPYPVIQQRPLQMGHAGHDHGVDIATTTAAGGSSVPTALPSSNTPSLSSTNSPDSFGVGESLIALCAAMPSLPSCALYEACKVNSTAIPNTSTTCLPTSLIANFCLSTIPSLSSLQTTHCSTYRQACPTTTTSECTPLATLPQPSALAASLSSLCSTHDMGKDCTSCGSPERAMSQGTSCRMLPAYIRMCKDMPNMSQCDGMDEMCTNGLCDAIIAADSKSSTASASTTSSTSSSSGGHNHGGSDGMLMAFHNNIQTPLLLAEWTPKTPFHYAIAWFMTLLLGVLHEAWQSLPVRLEHRFASSYTGLSRRGSDATAIDQSETLVTRASRGASRFGLRIVGAALSYLLMLIVMTFNLGLFFAVLMGLAIGNACFGTLFRNFGGASPATKPTGTSKHMPDDCC